MRERNPRKVMVADLSHRSIVQMAWVVNDLEEAAQRWHRTMGIGPFLVSRHIQLQNLHYRGDPSQLDFSTAIAQAGPIQVELVQQHCDSPSCYRDSIPVGREGFHHVAIVADDYDETLALYARQGLDIANAGFFGTARFSYVDSIPKIGHMVEVLEKCRPIDAFFEAIRKAAEEWNGDPSDLMREL